MRHADALLDSIGFSGYNNVVQAIECGLPPVTLEGRFLRGRLGSGILRRLEMPELIASSAEEYVEMVVQVDGKVRDRIVVPTGISEDDASSLAQPACSDCKCVGGSRTAGSCGLEGD